MLIVTERIAYRLDDPSSERMMRRTVLYWLGE